MATALLLFLSRAHSPDPPLSNKGWLRELSQCISTTTNLWLIT